MAMNYVTTMEISPVKLNLEAEEHCPETVSLASMVPFWDSSALLERSFLTQTIQVDSCKLPGRWFVKR